MMMMVEGSTTKKSRRRREKGKGKEKRTKSTKQKAAHEASILETIALALTRLRAQMPSSPAPEQSALLDRAWRIFLGSNNHHQHQHHNSTTPRPRRVITSTTPSSTTTAGTGLDSRVVPPSRSGSGLGLRMGMGMGLSGLGFESLGLSGSRSTPRGGGATTTGETLAEKIERFLTDAMGANPPSEADRVGLPSPAVGNAVDPVGAHLPGWMQPIDVRTLPASRIPIVLIHGIGVGLLPYMMLVRQLERAFPEHPLLTQEMPWVALRVCRVPTPDEVRVKGRGGKGRVPAVGSGLGSGLYIYIRYR